MHIRSTAIATSINGLFSYSEHHDKLTRYVASLHGNRYRGDKQLIISLSDMLST